jgi:serine protease AprX
MKSKVIIILLFFFGNSTFAQLGKYLVIFKDKNNNQYSLSDPTAFLSQRSVDRRQAQGISVTIHDLPPSQIYIDALKAAGATVWYTSRWLNAALVLMDASTASNVLTLPFVKGFETNGPMNLTGAGLVSARKGNKFDVELENIAYGNSSTQTNMLGLQHLHNASFKGEGKIIALLDDGYNNIDKDIYLASIFTENRIVDKYDFVTNVNQVDRVGGHGNLVLSTIAANVAGTFVGAAPQAKFALYRTEFAPTEQIIEEANYLFGCERADSLGADIINSSLGYQDYDFAPHSHALADYDGDKTLVTRAADWAAAVGILVCTSVGNSGNNATSPNIGAPADADSVLSVGAVTSAKLKSRFSSEGPTVDGRFKPDIAAMGSGATVSRYSNSSMTSVLGAASGTSFSSPIMAGFAACYWQANPELTAMQVIAAIKALGNQANSPDNNLGWGVPEYTNLTIGQNTDERLKVMQQGIPNSFISSDNKRIIGQIHPNLAGGIPVAGEVLMKTTIDATTQIVNERPTLKRHFTISPSENGSTVSATITLFVTQNEIETYDLNNSGFQDLVDPANPTKLNGLKVLQEKTLPDNTKAYNLIDVDIANINWNVLENFWEITFNVNGFSEFYITSAASAPLPVSLSSFDVQKINSNIIICWSTTSEFDFSHFEIEKSKNLNRFTTIGTVKSKHNLEAPSSYNFIDSSNVFTSNITYYRLKMVDLSGSFSYSKVISIKNDTGLFLKVLENPFTDKMDFSFENFDKQEDFTLEIFDLKGRLIYNTLIDKPTNYLSINTSNWQSGEYIVQITNLQLNISQKIIKQ